MPPASPRTLLISLGNPHPYLNTLHSAGHHALSALQPLLGPSQPPLAPKRIASKSALASFGPSLILLQSPSVMNISGKWVSKAWREILSDVQDQEQATQQPPSPSPSLSSLSREGQDQKNQSPAGAPPLSLLLVHDDLEEPLGAVKMRKWNSSHRGHNGVKSVNGVLRPADFPGARWARVSVGIGRPGSRGRETVSDYVLRDMTRFQRETLRDGAGEGMLRVLEEWGAVPS